MKQARDWAANAVGLRIETVALTGNQHVSREEVLAIAGVTGTTSLLFLDVEQTRGRLKSNPWIAEATVLKLYPRELQITIGEREAFALWQKDGAVSVGLHDVAGEIQKKTQDPAERDRLMHEYHNERVAELVRTKDIWLDKPEAWPIKVNQFNQVVEGNHRFRAIRYLGLAEVEVTVVQEDNPRPGYMLPEIWE